MDPTLTSTRADQPVGIVLLNMGGPTDLDAVGPFLLKLFEDRELIDLPLHPFLGPFIARRRTPKVQRIYEAIGGGSPILRWTRAQADGLAARLDQRFPGRTHRTYIAFRYTPPFAEDALRELMRDKVERVVAFSQYPQYSCATSGSSFNDLWATARRLGILDHFRWSIIDRWPTHPGFVRTLADGIRAALERFPVDARDDVVLLFSAHSLPARVIDRGDPYPQEIGATVQAVMTALRFSHRFVLAYQSQVGPVRWQGPSTESTIVNLAAQGHRHVLAVPVSFTSDHVETLAELDLEYGRLAHEKGITHYHRAPAPNDAPVFLEALADLVAEHLAAGQPCSTQYRLRCPGCPHGHCRELPERIHLESGVDVRPERAKIHAGMRPLAGPNRKKNHDL